MNFKTKYFLFFLLASCASSAPSTRYPSAVPPVPLAVQQTDAERANYEATGQSYGIAVQGRAAALAADEMYKMGGNIIDAAVAASFAISVERPHSTGLGGGGFLLFREARSGRTYAVDFRERAPLRASRDMYLDAQGRFQAEKSLNGILSVATPSLVAGLVEIHQRWGKLRLSDVVEPAAKLAESGFPVYPALSNALQARRDVLAQDPEARKIFLRSDGYALGTGELLVQKDLARTIRLIGEHGSSGFYGGPGGAAMVGYFKKQGGLIEKRDFGEYKVKFREAVQGNYNGFELFSMPPPSSGGIHVLQILNTVENDPLKNYGALSTQGVHKVAAAMQLAFADRAVYPGDPDFVKVPTKWLTSKSYAKERRATVQENRARPSSEVQAGKPGGDGHMETTHFSIMDKEGNAVASTQTINVGFGSGLVVPGTGVVLNDEMDDFSAKAGEANAYGAIGGEANSIAPGKRPLSSMSPTIVLKDGRPVMAVGAPGGTRIISCVAQTLLNYLGFGLPAYESVAAVRFHHQWQPDDLRVERGISADTLALLRARGHSISERPAMGSTQTIVVDERGFAGWSDSRSPEGAAAGF